MIVLLGLLAAVVFVAVCVYLSGALVALVYEFVRGRRS